MSREKCLSETYFFHKTYSLVAVPVEACCACRRSSQKSSTGTYSLLALSITLNHMPVGSWKCEGASLKNWRKKENEFSTRINTLWRIFECEYILFNFAEELHHQQWKVSTEFVRDKITSQLQPFSMKQHICRLGMTHLSLSILKSRQVFK